MRKIAIIGGSVWGNRGAAAMLETTIGKLRSVNKDIKFSIFTPYPSKDRLLVSDQSLEFFDSSPLSLVKYFLIALWGWLFVRFGKRPKFYGGVAALVDSDVLLDIGGITFADNRMIFLPYNILTIFPSLMFGVPVVKMSQAAGSFLNPIIRFFSKTFLSKCDYFFARGEKTLEFLKEINIDENKLGLAADIAFNYMPEYCLSSENTVAIAQLYNHIDSHVSLGCKVIAISPSVVVLDKMAAQKKSYIQLLVDILKIDENDVLFVVIPNAAREGSSKMRNNDIQVIQQLRDEAELQLPLPVYKRVSWVLFDVDTQSIEGIIKRADVLLASRFHAMVFGLKLGVPTMIIGWGHKYKEVMTKFRQEARVFDYSTSEKDTIIAAIKDVLLHRRDISSDIQAYLVDAKESSNTQFDYVIKKFVENQDSPVIIK